MRVGLELCVDSLASAIAAHSGGASRIELCDNLYEGGTTPSIGLLRLIRRRLPGLAVHVMIRPRGGDFLYTDEEKAVMRADIASIKADGGHGVVLGVLTRAGSVDEPLLCELVELSAPLEVTFHRAIDVAVDPIAATRACVRCGVSRAESAVSKDCLPKPEPHFLTSPVPRWIDSCFLIAQGSSPPAARPVPSRACRCCGRWSTQRTAS